MKGRELFMVLSGRILVDLEMEFPVPVVLNMEKHIQQLVNQDELWELDRKVSTIQFVLDMNSTSGVDVISSEQEMIAKKSLDEANRNIQDKKKEIQAMRMVWSGTVAFLESEGFIRQVDGGYQLTAKGFSQLNKPTDLDGERQRSVIAWLVEAVDPKNLVSTLASGTLNFGLGKLFGSA